MMTITAENMNVLVERVGAMAYQLDGEWISRDVAHAILGDELRCLEERWLLRDYEESEVGTEVHGHQFWIRDKSLMKWG